MKDKRIPFLFFANKMDIAGCLSHFECCASLGLDDIKTKPWHITCGYPVYLSLSLSASPACPPVSALPVPCLLPILVHASRHALSLLFLSLTRLSPPRSLVLSRARSLSLPQRLLFFS